METTLYSIGHGNKSIEEFKKELFSFGIDYIVDVRSMPYSKWNPDFNRLNMEKIFKKSYTYMGDVLGGLPEDKTFHDSEGKFLYGVMAEKDSFKKGLQRLIIANEKQIKIAIMCSESNPSDCHRSKLIGEELLKIGISIKHIIGQYKVKSQEKVRLEVTKGRNPEDLFGGKEEFKSRKAYQ
ncbi:MAG: DUF488 domain-containing protein [Bacteroidales bacterium]|nr:DUF488 domain-containing protein [Bacteroidales bacterium]MDD4685071.1 DUF488 domain-containing protein [Bacteroidales bacterium]